MDAEATRVMNGFLAHAGLTLDETILEPIPADGSRRCFWRVRTPGQSWIAMSNPPVTEPLRWENYAYLRIGNHLHRKGVPVPRVYHHDLGLGFFILEDMGPTNLQDAAAAAPDPLPLYHSVLEVLVRLQTEGVHGFDTSWCCQTPCYDRTVMRMYEAHYFRDAFLSRYVGLRRDWSRLEPGFSHLAEKAAQAGTGFLLHRDFQSRNILVCGDHIGIVDWQGARLGPLAYDLASLLIDPYSPLTTIQRRELYRHYLDLLKKQNEAWADSVDHYFPYLALQRNLQILGAFAYLTQDVGRPHFEGHIPKALSSLQTLLREVDDSALFPLRDLVMHLRLPQKPSTLQGLQDSIQ